MHLSKHFCGCCTLWSFQ